MSEVRPGTVMRIDSLTGLRWWAAFVVFAHHMSNLAPLPISRALTYGNYGVTFFFVLSGFVLTWSARPGVASTTFWWRRFARIYPSHFVALLLAIPVFYGLTPDPAQWWVKPFSVGILLLSVVLVEGWSRDPVILFSGNPAAWTLTCEAFFYALHPMFHRFALRMGRRGALVFIGTVFLLAFAYRLSVLMWPASWLAMLPLPVTRLSEFVIGIGIARAILTGWSLPIKPLYCYLAGGAFIAWLTISPRWADNPAVLFILQTANEWIILLCAITIAAVTWRDLQGGRSLLRSRPLVALGEWSFTFYLVHATVIYAVLAVLGPRAPAWVNLAWYAALLVIAVTAAAALHYLVERPVEKRMRRWLDTRIARRTAAVNESAPV